MITRTDRKPIGSFPTEVWPTTNTSAALYLYHAATYIAELGPVYLQDRYPVLDRDYNDHKASQILSATGDLIMAQARIEAWHIDLGFNGCQATEG